jgi:ATP-dependent helicase/nuclease subunit B
VLAALRLQSAGESDLAWREAADASPLALDGFVAWVDAVLERSSFMPAGPGGSAAQVVVTPLARAMLRPFAALVCAGADDRHLGAGAAPHPLLSDTERQALGLGGRSERRQRETLAFLHAAARAEVSFLRRHVDADGEPLADSPLLQRLSLDLAAQGRALAAWTDPRRRVALDPVPVPRPLPVAAAQLPGRISASAVQALRDCPYRFVARHVLGLREDDELEAEIEKRDYGTWLHAVLHRFHLTREAPGTPQAERERLHEIARAVQAEMVLADDEFLPFAAAFDGVAARYVAWLHERDAAGARWQDGERDCRIRPESLHGVELQGVIDRIDRIENDTAVQLIDYKTVKADKLKRQVREPLEDTQLAFYAALLSSETEGPLQACYLALDDDERVVEVPHADVRHSAEVLVRELGGEFARLRAGAPLPALGEEPTCEHCEARGLCRRDHWPDGQGA